eukprot:TRINITY_DN15081_c0_g1_i2.p1 TRINITY_DN15081_c0_g1~~TRINITY_DN15081_c0_g1_i2.p1  ORF type:complete len:784 (-),score=69.08 TRINITY_DN15081_c0_g1_i2:192-2300(-)
MQMQNQESSILHTSSSQHVVQYKCVNSQEHIRMGEDRPTWSDPNERVLSRGPRRHTMPSQSLPVLLGQRRFSQTRPCVDSIPASDDEVLMHPMKSQEMQQQSANAPSASAGTGPRMPETLYGQMNHGFEEPAMSNEQARFRSCFQAQTQHESREVPIRDSRAQMLGHVLSPGKSFDESSQLRVCHEQVHSRGGMSGQMHTFSDESPQAAFHSLSSRRCSVQLPVQFTSMLMSECYPRPEQQSRGISYAEQMRYIEHDSSSGSGQKAFKQACLGHTQHVGMKAQVPESISCTEERYIVCSNHMTPNSTQSAQSCVLNAQSQSCLLNLESSLPENGTSYVEASCQAQHAVTDWQPELESASSNQRMQLRLTAPEVDAGMRISDAAARSLHALKPLASRVHGSVQAGDCFHNRCSSSPLGSSQASVETRSSERFLQQSSQGLWTSTASLSCAQMQGSFAHGVQQCSIGSTRMDTRTQKFACYVKQSSERVDPQFANENASIHEPNSRTSLASTPEHRLQEYLGCNTDTLSGPRDHQVPIGQLLLRNRMQGGDEIDRAASQHDVKRKYTTVMIRNLPQTMTQMQLLLELDKTGFQDRYDFCYMPASFNTGMTKGFAFVNFASHELAARFTQAWHGLLFESLRVNISVAEIQGLEANTKKWSTVRFQKIRNPMLKPFIRNESVDTPSSVTSPKTSTGRFMTSERLDM